MGISGFGHPVCRDEPEKAKYFPEDDDYLLEKEETSALYELLFEKLIGVEQTPRALYERFQRGKNSLTCTGNPATARSAALIR